MILNKLVACQGWDELGRQVEIRCFKHEPSVASSLKFLRHTPWARSGWSRCICTWCSGSRSEQELEGSDNVKRRDSR